MTQAVDDYLISISQLHPWLHSITSASTWEFGGEEGLRAKSDRRLWLHKWLWSGNQHGIWLLLLPTSLAYLSTPGGATCNHKERNYGDALNHLATYEWQSLEPHRRLDQHNAIDQSQPVEVPSRYARAVPLAKSVTSNATRQNRTATIVSEIVDIAKAIP